MSFETSTNQSTFRPWHFFVLVALAAATMAVLMSRSTVVGTVLLSLVIGAAALVGMALLRTLQPLVNDDSADEPVLVGHRTRLAVEREKNLVLRSIKELEFDDPNSQKIINYIKERNNRSFLGWPPEPDDDYIEHISITLSFKRDAKPFNDILLYLERIRSVIADRVCQLKEQDDEQMDEINECLGISNDQ